MEVPGLPLELDTLTEEAALFSEASSASMEGFPAFQIVYQVAHSQKSTMTHPIAFAELAMPAELSTRQATISEVLV